MVILFDELIFENVSESMEHEHIQALVFFDNGYGASIIRCDITLSGQQGFYEVAIIKGVKGAWDTCFDTVITEDTISWLSKEGVSDLLERISMLNEQGYDSQQSANVTLMQGPKIPKGKKRVIRLHTSTRNRK